MLSSILRPAGTVNTILTGETLSRFAGKSYFNEKGWRRIVFIFEGSTLRKSLR